MSPSSVTALPVRRFATSSTPTTVSGISFRWFCMGPDWTPRNSPITQSFRAAIARRAPDLVFLNIALESTDAIECVVALGKKKL